MKYLHTLLLLIIIGFSTAKAQEIDHHNEVGFHVGGVMYVGDLSPQFNLSATRPGVQLFYRNCFKNNISVIRVNALVGGLYANEADSKNDFRKERGLELDKQFVSLSLMYEYNFLNFREIKRDVRFSPYLLVGLGVTTVLAEEENNFATLPFGIGIKYAIGKQININVEYYANKVFSDRLDGYDNDELLSSSTPNDWYHYFGVGLSYTIYKHICPDGTRMK